LINGAPKIDFWEELAPSRAGPPPRPTVHSRGAAEGFPAVCSHGFQRIGGKKQHDRAHQGHAEELAAIQFIEAAVALPKRTPEKEDVSLCKTRFLLRYN